MTHTQALTFAISTIKDAKTSMIQNGITDAQTVYAVCNKLSSMLNLDLDTIIAVIELN
jgi:hypothetical protein